MFKVLALDGVITGVLQFPMARDSTDWLRAVSANICDLTLQRVSWLLDFLLLYLIHKNDGYFLLFMISPKMTDFMIKQGSTYFFQHTTSLTKISSKLSPPDIS